MANDNSTQSSRCAENFSHLLPGCNWQDTVAPSHGPTADTPQAAGWWVRSSPKQVIHRKSGVPRGFRHWLMHGSKVIRTGVGADARRTFEAQAKFLNDRGNAGPSAPASSTDADNQGAARAKESSTAAPGNAEPDDKRVLKF